MMGAGARTSIGLGLALFLICTTEVGAQGQADRPPREVLEALAGIDRAQQSEQMIRGGYATFEDLVADGRLPADGVVGDYRIEVHCIQPDQGKWPPEQGRWLAVARPRQPGPPHLLASAVGVFTSAAEVPLDASCMVPDSARPLDPERIAAKAVSAMAGAQARFHKADPDRDGVHRYADLAELIEWMGPGNPLVAPSLLERPRWGYRYTVSSGDRPRTRFMVVARPEEPGGRVLFANHLGGPQALEALAEAPASCLLPGPAPADPEEAAYRTMGFIEAALDRFRLTHDGRPTLAMLVETDCLHPELLALGARYRYRVLTTPPGTSEREAIICQPAPGTSGRTFMRSSGMDYVLQAGLALPDEDQLPPEQIQALGRQGEELRAPSRWR